MSDRARHLLYLSAPAPRPALLLADRMRRRGVNVQPIVYPAVPEAAARLRFFLNTSHTDAHIDDAVAILAQESGRPEPATSRGAPEPSRSR
jgi:7-keto-8-aminopelargonate synthetase-like enzyme